MLLKMLLLIHLVMLAVICSQAIFYALVLTRVQNGLSAFAYLETRKLIDKNIAGPLRFTYYAAILTSLVLLKITFNYLSGLLFFALLLAFLALLTDLLIAVKANIPINRVINSWTQDTIPPGWEQTRRKWMAYYGYRQVLSIIGFLALVLGILFEN